MNLNILSSQTAEIIQELYSIEVSNQLDWHPALSKEGVFYQTSICDSLSDRIRISPATAARAIQQKLSALGFGVEIDNRGYVFIEASCFDSPEPLHSVRSVLIYLQPPTSLDTPLYYCKFLSQIAVQLEMLRAEGVEAQLYIPAGSALPQSSPIFDAKMFYGKEGIQKLFEIVRERQHPPALEDLSAFSRYLKDQSIKDRFMADSVVVWLTTDLLSIATVASVLSNLRTSLDQAKILNIRTTQIEAATSNSASIEFLDAIQDFGFAILAYLSQLDHASDLDWVNPQLENWLSLNWLLKSLESRLELLPESSDPESQGQGPGLRDKFLAANMEMSRQRAAFFGDSIGFLKALRELSGSLHTCLNKCQITTQNQLNNLSSFPLKFSSIIARF